MNHQGTNVNRWLVITNRLALTPSGETWMIVRPQWTGIGAGLLATACTPSHAQSSLTGLAQAKDGDSLTVSSREVRLFS